MDHLIETNMIMAQHELGPLDDAMQQYIQRTTCCLAKLVPSRIELKAFVDASDDGREQNPFPWIYSNRDYLNALRLAAKDIVGGEVFKLAQYGIDSQTATWLATLTNKQITRLATFWPGKIYRVDQDDLRKGATLHPELAGFHSASMD